MNHLVFHPRPFDSTERRTPVIAVISARGGMTLGEIRFSGAWRKYVFHPAVATQFDSGCMREISDFCDSETSKWRDSLKK